MGTNRGRKEEENKAKQDAQAAVAAVQKSPLEQRVETRTTKYLDDLDAGKDVRDIDYLKPYLNLYDSSVTATDAEKYSGNNLGLGTNSGVNPNLVATLDKANKLRTQREAAGQLYNAAQGARAQAEGQTLPYLIGLENNRQQVRVGATQNMYQTLVNRPREVPWWQQAVVAGIGAAGQVYAK